MAKPAALHALKDTPEEIVQKLLGPDGAKRLVGNDSDAKQLEKLAAKALLNHQDEAAEAAALAITAYDPKRARAWIMLGVSRAKMKRFSEAVPCFIHALELDALDVATWVDLGEAYISILDYTQAAKALQQAITLDPNAQHPAGRRARAIVGRTVQKLKSR
jgi:cytochrome c-type biogenesis protein CcmH/NrfG